MEYVKVYYMCPKCDQIYDFNQAEDFSTICPDCNIEMECIDTELTSTEEDEEYERQCEETPPESIVRCPYCQSFFTKKIHYFSWLGMVGKQFHCNNCGANF